VSKTDPISASCACSTASKLLMNVATRNYKSRGNWTQYGRRRKSDRATILVDNLSSYRSLLHRTASTGSCMRTKQYETLLQRMPRELHGLFSGAFMYTCQNCSSTRRKGRRVTDTTNDILWSSNSYNCAVRSSLTWISNNPRHCCRKVKQKHR
jgi:hypothetical protein